MTNKPCSYCGKEEHYAKGLCRACWSRMKRNGTLEYQYHRGPRPELWGDNTKQIIERLNCGEKQAEIARTLGVSRQLVNQVFHRQWKKSNYYKLTHMSQEKMAEFLGSIIHDYGQGTAEIEGAGYVIADWLEWLKEVDDDGNAP